MILVTLKNGSKKRWDGQIRLDWRNGEWEEDDQSPDSYQLLGFDQAHRYFWVEEEGYEDSNTALVSSETGQAYDFADADLLVSPDATHLLTHQGYEGRVQLWSFANEAIKPVAEFDISHIWEGRNVGCCAADFVWVTSREVVILDSRVVLARIKRQGTEWTFDFSGK
jgi:hypothetical protein